MQKAVLFSPLLLSLLMELWLKHWFDLKMFLIDFVRIQEIVRLALLCVYHGDCGFDFLKICCKWALLKPEPINVFLIKLLRIKMFYEQCCCQRVYGMKQGYCSSLTDRLNMRLKPLCESSSWSAESHSLRHLSAAVEILRILYVLTASFSIHSLFKS